jgi:hypothetical protein
MDDLLKQMLEEHNKKPHASEFYNVAVNLWHNRNDATWLPDILEKRIDFAFVPAVDNDKRIEELEERLESKISENEFVRYWSQFIQCFVKLKPLDNEDSDYVSFSVGYHVYADVVEIYPPQKRMKLIEDFKARWEDKDI